MKTLKTTILKTKYLVFALLVTFFFSCSSEDDAVGPQGEPGLAGTNGTDGNANVQTYTFDTSTQDGQFWNITAPQLTQDVLDNDAILAYLRRNDSYYPVPGTSFDDEIKLNFSENNAQFLFYDRQSGANTTPSVGTYDLFKLVIIKSSSTTAGRSNAKQQVYNKLNQAGVNINDYYAVCDYYGIAY